MAYTPPAGNDLALEFKGAVYTPAAGNAVPLVFGADLLVVVLTATVASSQVQTSTGTLRRTLPAAVATQQSQQSSAVAQRVLAAHTTSRQAQTSTAATARGLAAAAATQQGQSTTTAARITTQARAATAQAQRSVSTVRRFLPWYRGPAALVGLPQPQGTPRAAQAVLPWRDGGNPAPVIGLPQTAGAAQDVSTQILWRDTASADAHLALPQRAAPIRADAQTTLPWQALNALHSERDLPQRAAPIRADAQTWLAVSPMFAQDRERLLRWGAGVPTHRELLLPVSDLGPVARDFERTLPWQQAVPVPYRYSLRLPPLPPTPPGPHVCYTPPRGDVVSLLFRHAYTPPPGTGVPLAFLCRGLDALPPYFRLERSLMLVNTITVVRLPERTPLAVTAVSAALDAESLAWSFNIVFAKRGDLLSVAPSPTGLHTVEIAINGWVWQALIERYTDDRRFGQSTLSASGRSPVVQLLAPYATPTSAIYADTATASQIAGSLFAFSGYTVDWQAPDWTIPGGVFATADDTPLSALAKLAAAIDAIVQATPDGEGVVVASRYPISPWAWDDDEVDPAVVLDGGSIIGTGLDWQPGPGWQGVYVSGREHGVLARVMRDGTSGEPFAPVIVEPLITATEAATERGRVVLAKGEDAQQISLLMPLLASPAAPGLQPPGRLIEVLDPVWGRYRAQASSTAVEASKDGDAVIVRQRLSVRRHLREVAE